MSTAAARLWSDPDRWTVLALSQVAAVLFISLATLALGPSPAGIILLDAATTQFVCKPSADPLGNWISFQS